MSDAEHQRQPKHVLRSLEAYVLPRMAAALPKWVLPDHMTAVGAISAAAITACYALSGSRACPAWRSWNHPTW